MGSEEEAGHVSTPQSSTETPDQHSGCLEQQKPLDRDGLDMWSLLFFASAGDSLKNILELPALELSS